MIRPLFIVALLPVLCVCACSRTEPVSQSVDVEAPAADTARYTPEPYIPATDRTAIRDDMEKQRKVARIFRRYATDFRNLPHVSPEDAKSWNDAVWVDLRDESSRQISIIPGAISVEAFEAVAAQHRAAPIILYCTAGSRSGRYAKKLQERGYDAYTLQAGILGWIHAGLPIEHAGQPTNRIHVPNPVFDLAPAGYTVTW